MTAFYRAHVFVCTNERPAGHPRGSCKEKGAEGLRNYMKARAKELGLSKALDDQGPVRVNLAGCLDRCERGPALVIYGPAWPEGLWYSPQSNADIDAILQETLIEGRVVERLRMPPEAP